MSSRDEQGQSTPRPEVPSAIFQFAQKFGQCFNKQLDPRELHSVKNGSSHWFSCLVFVVFV